MKKLIMILVLALTCSCDYSQLAELNRGEEALEKRVSEYYAYEKSENWEKAYEYHLPEYQSAVEKDYYIFQMAKDNAGWKLMGFKVNDLRLKGHDADVSIEFSESAPKSFFESIGISKPVSLIVKSKIKTRWRLEENKWYVVDAGTRTRLSMNASIVP